MPQQAANAAAGQINTLGSAIPGVDTVTNPTAFNNGADAESDAAYKGRFPAYIANLQRGTLGAINNAIASVAQGVTFTNSENMNFAGAVQLGNFSVVVASGAGAPSGPFLAAIANAINAVRPFTSTFTVNAPTILTANVVMAVTGSTTDPATAQAALTAFINALGSGVSLPFTRLAQVAYDSSPTITNVTGVTLNTGTADLVASVTQIINAGLIVVT